MVEKTPQQVSLVAHAREWAANPAGGGKIFKWGTDGDFKRCEDFYQGKMPARMIPGWCATIHKLATGASPGHAPLEEAERKAKGK